MRGEPPLDPSPDEARSWLRRELLDPAYHDEALLQRLLAWLERQLLRGLDAAGDVPPLSQAAALVVLALLALALAWLATRVRATGRARTRPGAVLEDRTVTAADLRRRAEAALAAGRLDDALVDGFRALTARQVERGRLPDTPGATAHEVAVALAAAHPDQGGPVGESADSFDEVRYGGRHAARDRAVAVLALDDLLAGRR